MATARWHVSTLLLTLVLACGAAEHGLRSSFPVEEKFPVDPYIADEEYIRHIHSMYDAYRADIGGRLIIETNSLIDTKYHAWKRNADFINSLLAIPKGLNEAGR